MVIAVVLVLITAALLFGMATVTIALGGRGGIARDQSSKVAQAAADAGVTEAIVRYQSVTTNGQNACVSGTPPNAAPAGGGGVPSWCAPVSGSVVGSENESFTIWVRPDVAQNNVTDVVIVSQGRVGTWTRAVEVTAVPSGGKFVQTQYVECASTVDPAAPANGC
jgi:hypothetical protein